MCKKGNIKKWSLQENQAIQISESKDQNSTKC